VDGSYRVFAKGGRVDTGLDALEWIRRGTGDGAGEIVLNSIDTDGVRQGFDLPMLRAVCEVTSLPVIASGGAGSIQDFVTLFREVPGVDAGLAASIFHFGEVEISELKACLDREGIPVRW
jgi:cyclase